MTVDRGNFGRATLAELEALRVSMSARCPVP